MNLEILLIAVLIAWACAIPGVFLVLRKMTLMADAISHSVLPGIVIGYLLSQSLDGPIPLLGAVAASLLTVALSELLLKSKLVGGDAAIGLVFPAMFSVGVLLVAHFAGEVHLDLDAVLLGELVYAPLDRILVGGLSLPRSLVTSFILVLVNLVWSWGLFKELKLATFDPGLARSLGFRPVLLHYGLMTAVSITSVGAFDAVGSVLVVAFIVAPAASAYLLFDSLKTLLLTAPIIGALGAVTGYFLAMATDTSLAGAMALCSGILFLFTLLGSPKRGILAAWNRRRLQRWNFAIRMLVVHISHHQFGHEEALECSQDHLTDDIDWTERFARQVVEKALSQRLISRRGHLLTLTAQGTELAEKAVEE